MLQRRTDLALEAREIWESGANRARQLHGVESEQTEREGFPVTTVRITGQEGARALGKPEGTYVTLELAGLHRREEEAFPRAVRALAAELRRLLPQCNGTVLVAGLGNRAITPDNVGPTAVEYTLVTRHLVEQVPAHFGHFRPVAALAAGVLANTGMESSELVGAVTERISPSCVIVIDALASRSLNRVCCTVQLADTGISPGSGVGNHRAPLNRETLGVPVIALGVPTVVDAATLCADVLAEAGRGELEPDALHGMAARLMVTPTDIDRRVADLSKVIGYAVSLALQEDLTVEDLDLLLE